MEPPAQRSRARSRAGLRTVRVERAAVLPRSPAARSPASTAGASRRLPGSRLVGDNGARWLTDANFTRIEALTAFAAERDHTVGELALAWLAAQPVVCSVIAGATRPEQVRDNVAALEWRMSRDDRRKIDALLAGTR